MAGIPFVIEEITGSNRRKLTLEGPDIPRGMPRVVAGWTEGGQLQRDVTFFDGNSTPVYHVHQPRYAPRTIKGQLRDHLWAAYSHDNAAAQTHARTVRDALLSIWRRARILRCSWGGESFTGMLHQPSFPVEGQHDIEYELVFDVASVSTQGQADPKQRQITPRASAGAQMLADFLKQATALKADLTTLGIEAKAAEVLAALADAVNNGIQAANDALTVAQAVVVGTPSQALAVTKRLSATAVQVVQQAQDLKDQIGSLKFEDAVEQQKQTASAELQYQSTMGAMADFLTGLAEGMRAMRADAESKIKPKGQVYRVQPGDTAESIARQKLGSAGRADELHLTSKDLQPGRVIRLPL